MTEGYHSEKKVELLRNGVPENCKIITIYKYFCLWQHRWRKHHNAIEKSLRKWARRTGIWIPAPEQGTSPNSIFLSFEDIAYPPQAVCMAGPSKIPGAEIFFFFPLTIEGKWNSCSKQNCQVLETVLQSSFQFFYPRFLLPSSIIRWEEAPQIFS